MSNTSKSRKPLIIGIIGAVVVLAALLVLLLTQCTGSPAANTQPTTDPVVRTEGYELYWNVDRKEFDGKSEAGMSSRKPASDGYFHVRFFKDGEMLELKVADRKLINTIDTNDLMGLEFDEEGIVVGVIRADRMPLERVGWQFYVQSTGGNLIKLNSSRRFDGLEVLLEVEDYTAIYDMTGLEGEVGRKVDLPSEYDRVIAIADLQGRVTHVFVTDRSEFMFTVEAECQHCKQVVSWKQFTKTNEFPTMSGHYILQNDIKLKGSQVQLPEDCSICVDLNGKTVSKTDGGRMISLFNPGCMLALMDSSEDQSGTILVSGEGTQGLGIWLRYGEFHFYGGTIDATAANTRSGGAAVALDANTFMYMHGGTIRGGNAKTEYNPDTNSYSRGMGGAVLVVGKFVMNGGLIEGGKAIPIPGYNAKGQPVNNRGYGGNLLARGAATVELNGGIIRNGYAGTSGGNLYIDGTAELLLNGTQIQGGYVDGRGCNGGSVYVGGKATATMTGGSITGGYCYNEGANVYCSGTFNMQGGYIGGGTVYTYGTGKVNEKCASANLFLVNGTLNHYGGTIAGGVHAIDTSKTRACTVVLAGSPVIDGGKDAKTNLNLNTNGDGVKLVVSQLTDYARIGVNSVGIFSEKTDKANADNFFSDLGGEVIHYQERLAVGKLGCICGSESHYGECDGTQQLFVPHTKENTLPLTEGYWYLTQDIQLPGQQGIRGQQNIVLDLNGHTVTSADGARAYALFDPELPITLTLTDSSKEKTGAIKAVGKDVQAEGQCVWIRTAGQTLNLYDVTLDASEATNARNGAALYGNAGTTINMYAGRITGGTAQANYRESSKAVVNGMGGNVYTNGVFVMYGGSISGGKALSAQNADQVYMGGLGGNLAAGSKAEVLLLGGTISGGEAHTSGGNIYVNGSKAVILKGVSVSGGIAGCADRAITGSGGNIASTGCLVLESGSVTGGKTNGNGGNIHLTAAGSGDMTGGLVSGGTAERGGNLSTFGKFGIYGGTVSGGTAGAGGNLFVYGGTAQAALHGGTFENGAASGMGGNVYVGADGASADLKNVKLLDGTAEKGGNLALAQKCKVSVAAAICSGTATDRGGNIYLSGGELLLTEGTVEGGSAPTGGNIYLDGSAALVQRGGTVSGGTATVNGGNLFVSGAAAYSLLGGAVKDGVITRDGAANIDMRGTFVMEGGTVSGGVRVDEKGQAVTLSDSKLNLFAYKAAVNISGGQIDGGVLVHTDATTLKLSGDACIASRAGKPGLTLNSGALMTLGQLSKNAKIVVSNGENTKLANSGSSQAISSDRGLMVVSYGDGSLWLSGHTHCASGCGGTNGNHAEGCKGGEEAWTLWDGKAITASGKYCLHTTAADGVVKAAGQISIGKDMEVSICLGGNTLSAPGRAFLVKEGGVLNITDCTGKGAVEGKGPNKDSGGVICLVDGTVNLYAGTLRKTDDEAVAVSGGGVVRVDANGVLNIYGGTVQGGKVTGTGGAVRSAGVVNMYGGAVKGGTAQYGGAVYVGSGSFTMYGGTISGGKAANGGNVYLNAGSFTMAEDGDASSVPLITEGYATDKNGGNVFIAAGSGFTMECGNVAKGYQSGGDGVGNFYVRGTLTVSGGDIMDGYRVEDDGVTLNTGSQAKANVFAVDGTLDISGGHIHGGVLAHNNKAASVVKLSKDAWILAGEEGKASLTLSNGALLTIDGKLGNASSVVLSNGANTCVSESTERGQLSSDKGLVLSAEADGKLYLRAHTHCSLGCGMMNGTHVEGCQGVDEAWTLWNGGDITESGRYCLHEEVSISKTASITAPGVTLLVDGILTSSRQALWIKEGAEVTLLGSGTIQATGVDGETTGVVGVIGGDLILDGVTLRQIPDESITVKMGGILRLTAGSVTMYSGEILDGKATNGGNVYLGGGSFTMYGGSILRGKAVNGGNVYLGGGSFTMADDGDDTTEPVVDSGYAAGKNGGNLFVASGTEFTMACGRVSNGYQSGGDGVGNCYVAGTMNVLGGSVMGGYRVEDDGVTLNNGSQIKRNIFVVNGTLNVSGGYVFGGVMVHDTNPGDSKAVTINLSKSPYICSDEDTKSSLSLSNGALLTIGGKLADTALVALSNGADTCISAGTERFGLSSDKGLILSAEADGKLYLRSHTHCTVCGHSDGIHVADCAGADEAWTKWDGGNITASGKYCIHDTVQIGTPAEITATDVTLLVEGTLTSTKRTLNIKSGADVTLMGSGIIEGTGANNENTGVVIVDGKLTIDGVTVQQIADASVNVKNGGVLTVGSTGQVTMESGTIQGGKASNGGGNVFVNGGSFTLKGGSIQNGTALVGGNIFLYGSGSFTQKSGTISGGTATGSGAQGGNVSVNSGLYTLEGGSVENGKISEDGAGNIDVRSAGTLTVTGGTVSGGVRINAQGQVVALSQVKRNVFVLNGKLNVSGGELCGGVNIHGGSGRLNLSKDAAIRTNEAGKPSLSLSGGALLAVDGALNNADIVLSDAADTKLAASGSHAYKNHFTSDKGLVVSVEADGMYLRTHTHCSVNCGQLDGKHVENCTGYDVAGWTKWDGGGISAAGSYCLHEDKTLDGPATISAQGVTLLVNANLSSAKQALVIASGADVTLMGSGMIAGKGENAGNGGVVYVDGGKLTVQNLTLQQTADSAITVKYGGVVYVASGSVTLESGTVQSGKASYGGNIYVAAGSVTQNGALVTGGTATAQATEANKAQGGNIGIAAGATYTLSSGTIQDGSMAALDGAGNIDVRGTFLMEGGTVTGGYRAAGGNIDLKNNIFAVNGTVQLTGGQIDGGVMIFSITADRAQLQVGKDAKLLTNGAGKGLTLYQSKVIVDTATITANASLKLTGNQSNGTMATGLVIAQSKDNVTMTHSVKNLFGADSQGIITVGSTSYKLSLEKDNKLYVRAGDAHIHCLCGRTDGTHAEGCGGWDVVFEPTTSFPTASGNYYLNAAQVKANQLQLGTSDGSTNVSINLCLAGKEVTNDSGKARIALIWGGSSLTITDCGSGTIKANATTGNGGIFHPAKNSNLTIYKGALDASAVSSAKPGVAIDNAGTTKIYGGAVLGGNATAENANGTGGAIRNTGTLLIAGGTVSGGKAAYRGGNIYSENGSVTISGGNILNGWVCNDSANIDVRGGSLTVSGGTISGGNRYTNSSYTAVDARGEGKRNIFTVNTTVVISGGEIDGGVQLHKTSGGSVTISGAPKIASAEAGKKNLTTAYKLIIGKPGMDKKAQIKVTSAPAGALAVAESGLTLTSDMAACFVNDSGVAATLENNQILFK